MARSRVYCPEISCPECGSNWMRKNGFTNGRQAYRCGDCKRGYSPDGAYRRPGKSRSSRASPCIWNTAA